MQLNEYGKIATACWEEIPIHFAGVELDTFVVMPNHIHGVVVIANGEAHPSVGATHASPLQKPRGPQRKSLGSIIGAFKSASTKRINEMRQALGMPLWQRNYYEHVIRDENEWNRIREYIAANPTRWTEDVHNPVYRCDTREKRLNAEFEGIFTAPRYGRRS